MSSTGRERLLAERSYDVDARMIESDSEGIVSDSEDYSILHTPRTTDRQVLEDAEIEERLLRPPGRIEKIKNSLTGHEDTISRRKRLNAARSRRIKDEIHGNGSSSLIYGMEGGYKDNSSRSSAESLVLKDEKWNVETLPRRSYGRIILIALGIVMLFILLSYGTYKASYHNKHAMFSNGTHVFGPTTILISLDGFRADFLQRGLTPAMKAFIESGVSPKYMSPSFPSLTFPNHFTLVTGLYPESHGIVSNQFWDPKMEEEFYYTDIENSMQPKWWNAEPLWVTFEKAGLKSAIHMWPGSEAHIDDRDPTYLDKYNGSESLDVKVDHVMHWLDMPQEQRPQFIGVYVPDVDADGHKYGPNSTEIRATIAEVDSMLTSLVEGLFQRNLTEIVNIIIVSDHGMATTSNDRLIQLDDYIDMSLVDHIDGWPLKGLRLKNPDRDVSILYKQLLDASKGNNFDVYTRETMPERYHFSKNDRIAPLWVIPRAGWVVVEKDEFDVIEAQATGRQYEPMGLHGYDHEHPLMRAIFIARGPAFPHSPNSRVPAFQNIEVYNIVCDSLGIEPHPNNGTLRLPLKTEGLHSDFDDSKETPADPVVSSPDSKPDIMQSKPESTHSMTRAIVPQQTATRTGEATAAATSDQHSDTSEKEHSSWWKFVHNQLEKAKQWAKELIESIKNNHPSSGQDVQ